jgi:hypothetical protein
MGVSLTGVHFTGMCLTGYATQGRLYYGRASVAGLSLEHVSHRRAFMDVPLVSVPLMGDQSPLLLTLISPWKGRKGQKGRV